jgi:hypothetical protein
MNLLSMLGKIMGFMDVAVAAIMLLAQYAGLPAQVMISASVYLFIKAAMFFGDLMSIIDGIVGLYLLIMLFFRPELVTILFAIYLAAKGAWSMF